MRTRIDDGGPAFPRPASIDTRSGTLPDGDTVIPEQDGLTLRDYFAAHASEGDVQRERYPNSTGPELTPSQPVCTRQEARYRHADAMIAVRQAR